MLHIHRFSTTTKKIYLNLNPDSSPVGQRLKQYFPGLNVVGGITNNFATWNGIADYPEFKFGFDNNTVYYATLIVDDTPGEEKIILLGTTATDDPSKYLYTVVGLTEEKPDELFANNRSYPMSMGYNSLNIPSWAPSPGVFPDEIKFIPLIGVATNQSMDASNYARTYRNIAVSTNYLSADPGLVYEAANDEPGHKWVSVGGRLFVRCTDYEIINEY